MAQLSNQLVQAPVKGQMDLRYNPSVIACEVSSTEAGTLVPGQGVTIVDSAGGIPKVIAAAADTSDVFGFVVWNARKESFVAGDQIEVAAFRNNVMYLEASAAIARGAKFMIVVSGSKIATATGTGKKVVGRTIDKASANGDLIRCLVDLPVIETLA